MINVIDEAPNAILRRAGFRPFPSANNPDSKYVYDDNGNMIRDPHKLMKFEYNFLNLPQVADSGDTGIENIYDATGRKWQTTSTVDILDQYGSPTGETYTETKLYLNGIEFVGEGTVASRLSSINPSSNGRKAYEAGAVESRIEYYHTDHLGNVRLAFSDLDGDNAITVRDIYYPANEIVQERHYYPFGLTHTGPWFATVAPDNAYRYNGKELDEATGLYDYGARWYDPAVARWGQVDPLADYYAPYSPYNYVLNMPINTIDPDGMRVKAVDDDSQNYIMQYLDEMLGTGHGFSFNKQGVLKFKKKDVAEGKEYSSEQQEIVDGMKEIAKDANTVLHVVVSEDENVNVNINTSSGFSLQQNQIDKDAEGNFQAGIMVEIGFPLDGTRNAVIMINRGEASTKQSTAQHCGLTEACESCVFFHEALDHGLHFVRTGVGLPPNRSILVSSARKQEVYYQNKALRVKGGPDAKIRDGRDHGDH